MFRLLGYALTFVAGYYVGSVGLTSIVWGLVT